MLNLRDRQLRIILCHLRVQRPFVMFIYLYIFLSVVICNVPVYL